VSGIEVDIWLSKTEEFIEDMKTVSNKIKKIKLDSRFSPSAIELELYTNMKD
jgi:hypothetical protein